MTKEVTMNLQDKLDNLRDQLEAGIPADTLAIMHNSTAELVSSGIMDDVLNVGASAPAFTLCDQNGNDISSADLLSQGPLVLTFYRGVW